MRRIVYDRDHDKGPKLLPPPENAVLNIHNTSSGNPSYCMGVLGEKNGYDSNMVENGYPPSHYPYSPVRHGRTPEFSKTNAPYSRTDFNVEYFGGTPVSSFNAVSDDGRREKYDSFPRRVFTVQRTLLPTNRQNCRHYDSQSLTSSNRNDEEESGSSLARFSVGSSTRTSGSGSGLFVIDTDGCETKELALLDVENDNHNLSQKSDGKNDSLDADEATGGGTIKSGLEKLQRLLVYHRYRIGLSHDSKKIPSDATDAYSPASSSECLANKIRTEQLDRQLKKVQWELQEKNRHNWANCLRFDARPPEWLTHKQSRYYFNIDSEQASDQSGATKVRKTYNASIDILKDKNEATAAHDNNTSDEVPCKESGSQEGQRGIKLSGGRSLSAQIVAHFRFMSYLHSMKKNTCFTCGKSTCKRSLNSRLPCGSARCSACAGVGHMRRHCRQPDIFLRQMLTTQQDTYFKCNFKPISHSRMHCFICGGKGHFICGQVPEPKGLSTLDVRSNICFRASSDTCPHLFDGWFVWTQEVAEKFNEQAGRAGRMKAFPGCPQPPQSARLLPDPPPSFKALYPPGQRQRPTFY